MLKSRYFKPRPMSSNVASLSSLLPRPDTGAEFGVGERSVLPAKCELARAVSSVSRPVTKARGTNEAFSYQSRRGRTAL